MVPLMFLLFCNSSKQFQAQFKNVSSKVIKVSKTRYGTYTDNFLYAFSDRPQIINNLGEFVRRKIEKITMKRSI